ncbi:hypothetical protein MKW98_015233 [Papaver atlanticum]|uniref:Uncharacterized protein n=1 Tax=Papaver atlanticum TaxID=357466 RepID=A0AAD4T351_9MAGN|nr:hypothetical protein MKW98_015233 [Papaver atlanticum]
MLHINIKSPYIRSSLASLGRLNKEHTNIDIQLHYYTNGTVRHSTRSPLKRQRRKIVIMLLCASVMLSFAVISSSATSTEAYPSDTYKAWSSDGEAETTRELEEFIDISHTFRSTMPKWGSSEGLGQFLTIHDGDSMKNGSIANFSEMKLPIHTGTHVDAPGHVFDHYFDACFDVDTLDLEVLNGPALLVDMLYARISMVHLNCEVMKYLNIPKGVSRVLFRTLNTDRKLMWKSEFDTSYVGFMRVGAKWLVENTDIKLVGVDYLSVAAYDDLIPSHLEIILVEGLKLDDVKAVMYNVHCLPLRLFGAEGSPIRCILIR